MSSLPPIMQQPVPQPKRSSPIWYILGALFLFICVCPIFLSILAPVGRLKNQEDAKSSELAPAKTAPTSKSPDQSQATPAQKAPEPVSPWNYQREEDGMGRGDVLTAYVTSTNTVSLDFPYQGEQHATLMLRKHPEHGEDVIFQIERGQLLTDLMDGTKVPIRFDSGSIRSFRANPPADHSTESLFIDAFDTFMDRLPRAKTVKIEVQIYQEGNRTFVFDVSGFDASKMK